MKILTGSFLKTSLILALTLAMQLAFAGEGKEEVVTVQIDNTKVIHAVTFAEREHALMLSLQLLIGGIAALGTGLTDWYFHAALHAAFHGDEEDHSGDEEDHSAHLMPTTEEHKEPIPDHIAAQMRKYSHIFEGICTIAAAGVRGFGAYCCNDKHFRMCKALSDKLQALSFFGTAVAAIADFGHGHIVHGICHTGQAASTLFMTIPNIMRCTSNDASTASSNKRTKNKKNYHNRAKLRHQNSKTCKDKSRIGANLSDSLFSTILAVLLKSPFYALEAGSNLAMATENTRYYIRKNILDTEDSSYNLEPSSSLHLLTTTVDVGSNNEDIQYKAEVPDEIVNALREKLEPLLDQITAEKNNNTRDLLIVDAKKIIETICGPISNK